MEVPPFDFYIPFVRGKISEKFYLWTIIILALAIRLYRIDWGLPWEYWGDEGTILSYVSFMALTKSLNPYIFNYSSLIFYIALLVGSAVYVILNLFGAGLDWNTFWQSFFGNPTILAGAVRIVQALIGTATVYFTYQVGRQIGHKIGLISALIVSLSPLAIVESKKYGGDGIMALLTTIAILETVKFCTYRKKIYFIAASLLAGLAAGTKYFGGLVLFSIWVNLYFINQKSIPKFLRSKLFWESLMYAGLGFLISSPYILITPIKFLHDFGFELFHAMSGHLGLEHAPPGFIGNTAHLAYGLSTIGLLLSIAGITIAFKKKDKIAIIIFAFPIITFALIGFLRTTFARYFCILIPPLSIATAYTLHKIKSKIIFALIILSLGELIIRDYGITRYFSLPGTNDLTREWININISPDTPISAMNFEGLFYPSTEQIETMLKNARETHKVDSLKFLGMLRFSPIEYRRAICFIKPTIRSKTVFADRFKAKLKSILGKYNEGQTPKSLDIYNKIKECGAKYFIAQSQYYLRHMAAPDFYPEYVEFYRKLFVQKPVFEIGNEFITMRELPPLKILLTAKVAGQKFKIFDITRLPRKNP